MFKPLVTGVTACAVILTAAGLAQRLADAQESAPLVPSDCPGQPVWTVGFGFYERIALGPAQYRTAVVNSQRADVHTGVGFESEKASFTLQKGDRVEIVGEAWDRGCHQWMEVQTDQGMFWMYGNTLADAPQAEGSEGVQQVCPEVTWVGDHLIGELIPLAPDQYKAAVVTGNGVNVRDRPGRDANAPFTLNQGSPVVVMGETFDNNCDQWMQVTTDRQSGTFWIHGSYVAVQEEQVGIGPTDPIENLDVASGQPLITAICPNAPWTEGFRVYELIALATDQYHTKRVTANDVRLRAGVGFDASTVKRLDQGAPVLVTGEAWDSGCNQWMQVQTGGDRLWVSGNYLQ